MAKGNSYKSGSCPSLIDVATCRIALTFCAEFEIDIASIESSENEFGLLGLNSTVVAPKILCLPYGI